MPAAGEGARRAIAARAGDWTLLLQDLIRIPSCFEAEHAIVARVCEHVAAIGLTPVLVPMDAAALRRHADAVEPISEVAGRNNIVVRLPGRGGGRSLILNCHLDTQPAGDPGEWTHPPFSGHVDADQQCDFRPRRHGRQGGRRHLPRSDAVIVEQRLQSAMATSCSISSSRTKSPATAAWHVSGGRPHRRRRHHCRRHAPRSRHRSARRQHGVSRRAERAARRRSASRTWVPTRPKCCRARFFTCAMCSSVSTTGASRPGRNFPAPTSSSSTACMPMRRDFACRSRRAPAVS